MSFSCAECLPHCCGCGSSLALHYTAWSVILEAAAFPITLVIPVRADGVLIFKFDTLPASDLNSNGVTTVNAENMSKIQKRGGPIGAGFLIQEGGSGPSRVHGAVTATDSGEEMTRLQMPSFTGSLPMKCFIQGGTRVTLRPAP